MKARSCWTALFFVPLVFPATGCISWHSGASPITIAAYPPSGKTAGLPRPVNIGMQLTFQMVGMYIDEDDRKHNIDHLMGWAQDAFEEIDAFQWSHLTKNADYLVSLHVRDDVDPNILMAILSGLTLTMIPAWAINDYTITATLQDEEGRVLSTQRIQRRFTTLFQFFMLFGMPFANPRLECEEMWRGIFRDLAGWCYAEIAKLELKGKIEMPSTAVAL